MTVVLVGIDGSEHARDALQAAVGLIGRDAGYVLLSIIPPWSPTHGADADEAADGPNAPGEVPEAADALHDYYRVAQHQAAVAAGIERVEHVVEEARPQKRRIGRQICESAAAHHADLIVIGSHGASHAGELLLGSVSQYVLHHAPIPVLVVRPRR